jgi:hypothetical protein
VNVDGSRAGEILVYSGSSKAKVKSMAKPSKYLLKRRNTLSYPMHSNALEEFIYLNLKKVIE